MIAFKAAKRTPVLMLLLFVVIAATPALAADGKGYLGVSLQDISPSMAKALQLGDRQGVLINEVVDDSPAAKAGLTEGDVILAFDGNDLSKYSDLTDLVRAYSPGQKAQLLVLRDGKEKKVEVELGELERETALGGKGLERLHERLGDRMKNLQWFGDGDHKVMVLPENGRKRMWIGRDGDVTDLELDDDRGFLGVHMDGLNGQLGEYFGVKDGKGALVTEVTDDSPAAKAGLKAGDVIVKLGDQDIDSPDALHKAMSGTEPGQEVAVKVVRKGNDKTFKVTLAEMPEFDVAGDFEFFDGDDDNQFIMRAPRATLHRLPRDGDIDIEVLDRDHPRLKVRRQINDESELKEMRQELDQLRDELKKMREELKK